MEGTRQVKKGQGRGSKSVRRGIGEEIKVKQRRARLDQLGSSRGEIRGLGNRGLFINRVEGKPLTKQKCTAHLSWQKQVKKKGIIEERREERRESKRKLRK